MDAVIHIIESAEKHYQYNTDVQNIINEEAESYFSGQKDAYTVVNIIQNRVSLYVEEQRD